MNQIALIIGDVFVYWSPVLVTLGVLTAVCVFLALYLSKSGNGVAASLCVPLAIVLSVLCARLVHWYCRTDSYDSVQAAMTDFASGGFALPGAFAGCMLAALLLRLLRISRNLPEMLDCMSLAGCAGIAVGRLSSFFDSTDRGIPVSGGTMPWVYPVTNPVSGATEYRLATFAIQAMMAAGIFLGLLLFYLVVRHRKRYRQGDVCVIVLLCYGASQVLLDSTRYDSLYFRSNGFVSIVQVLGALAIGLGLILFSVRLVKNRGWKPWYCAVWIGAAAMLGLGGYMEYHVQRHGNEAVFAYSVMGGCLLGLVVLSLGLRWLADRPGSAGKEKGESVWTG